MNKTGTQGLLLAIALLLGANLGALLIGREPGSSLQVLPQARADHGATEIELRTGKGVVTTSPDGSTLYVWCCKIVNGEAVFEGARYTAQQ